jgi:hypothetical protein
MNKGDAKAKTGEELQKTLLAQIDDMKTTKKSISDCEVWCNNKFLECDQKNINLSPVIDKIPDLLSKSANKVALNLFNISASMTEFLALQISDLEKHNIRLRALQLVTTLVDKYFFIFIFCH